MVDINPETVTTGAVELDLEVSILNSKESFLREILSFFIKSE